MSNLNPENKCAQLFTEEIPKLNDPIVDMFKMQASLQAHLAAKGRAVDYTNATHKERVDDISRQWRNLTLEFAEMLERLPFKEWKTYPESSLVGFKDDADMLETYYEYIDMWHFFMNMGLALGIDGETFEKLYVSKNKENFDRQARGY
jgi:dimeric dUTPase (all-alpha-NTP-PPase superfamily)